MAPLVVAVIAGASMLLPAFVTSARAAAIELPSSAIVGPSAMCAGGTWNVSWSLQNRDARPVEVAVKVEGTAVAFTANPVQPGQTATATRQFPATGFQGSLAQSVAYVGAQGAVSMSRLDLPYCSLPTSTRPPPRPVSIETFPPASVPVPVPVPQATTAKPTAPPTTALVTTTATSSTSTSTTTTAVADETTTTSESTTTTEVVPGTALLATVGSVPGTTAVVVPVTVAVDATPVASSGPGPWLWVAGAILAAGIVSAAAIGLRRRT